jgi:hypothetical protein
MLGRYFIPMSISELRVADMFFVVCFNMFMEVEYVAD